MRKNNGVKLAALFLGLSLCTGCHGGGEDEASYTVTFSPNYSGAPESQVYSVKSGETAEEPQAPERENYSFAGWYQDYRGLEEFSFDTPIEENTRLFAKWEQTNATVTFDTLGGTPVEALTVTVGETAAAPEQEPEKENYSFAGWYQDGTCRKEFDFENTQITGDTTVYAKWMQENAAVTFVEYDDTVYSEAVVSIGETVEEPGEEPVRENYKFLGWYEDAACTREYDFDSQVEEDVTVYAGWELSAAVVTFDTGSETFDQQVEVGETVEEPQEPERSGWTFAGWYTGTQEDAQAYDFKEPVSANLTLYAHWETSEFTVTFDYNCEELENTSQTVAYGGELLFPETDPEREGYYFTGWFADPEMSAYFDDTQPISEDTVIYAGWEAIESET